MIFPSRYTYTFSDFSVSAVAVARILIPLEGISIQILTLCDLNPLAFLFSPKLTGFRSVHFLNTSTRENRSLALRHRFAADLRSPLIISRWSFVRMCSHALNSFNLTQHFQRLNIMQLSLTKVIYRWKRFFCKQSPSF